MALTDVEQREIILQQEFWQEFANSRGFLRR